MKAKSHLFWPYLRDYFFEESLFKKVAATVAVLAVPVLFFAEQLRINVCDGELNMPLEGARVFMNEDRSLFAETDADGNAVLELGEDFKRGNLICQFPGYAQFIALVKSGQEEINVVMQISDFLEGKEIVVARASEKSEQKSGVSVVFTKEQMDTTARTGLVEDVMSSVNTMPGMTFGGQWNSEPSVRGGYPREMAYALDGVYLMFPWHWGGAYSIFSPNFVESTKLSNGVFSAKYGHAVSGLLEVNTIMPDDELHFSLDLNYTSTAAFLSSPLGKNSGIILGTKVTYLETLLGLYRLTGGTATDMIAKAPYIRDFYAKYYVQPTDKLNLTFNGLFGSDGIGLDANKDNVDSEDDVITVGEIDYDYYQAFLGLNASLMATDSVTVNGRLAWTMMNEDLNMDMKDTGFISYNPDFLELYGNLISPEARARGGYDLDTRTQYKEKVLHQMVQAKEDTFVRFNESSEIVFGAEEALAFGSVEMKGNMWSEVNMGGAYPEYHPIVYSSKADNNKTWATSGFILWNYGNDETLVNGELGLRLDHMKITGRGIDITSQPDVNPRGTIHYTPWRDIGPFDRIVFSTGAGLFSAVPFDSAMISSETDVSSGARQDRSLFTVIGTELDFTNDWKITLEAYYKQCINRLYVVNDERDPQNVISRAYTDGKGYTTGFDVMVSKDIGERWNGYLTYSYIYARYKNPTSPVLDNQRTTRGDPLDEWYFPSFHRFNTLNLIVNYKPAPRWIVTLKGTFATGTPRTDGDRYCYPVKREDGTVMQRYTRSWYYSDTLRTDFSCPVDIRVAHTGTFRKHPKWNWEWYMGAEDIFMNLYSPKGSDNFNQTTGKKESSDVNFSIGIPMISMGLKISY